MKNTLFSILIITTTLLANAQFVFDPIHTDISDIKSNDSIVLMCNSGCNSFIRGYDMRGDQIDLKFPRFNQNNGYSKIKVNTNGEFLVGGGHASSDDVLGLESGIFVIKYDRIGKMIFAQDIKYINDTILALLVFGFISNNHIALGLGYEKLFIINEKGSIIDSLLFNEKIVDVCYLNDKQFVLLNEKNDLLVINETYDIINKISTGIQTPRNNISQLANVDESSIIAFTNHEAVLIKKIGTDSIEQHHLATSAEINDLITKNRKIHILSNQNLIQSYDVDSLNQHSKIHFEQGIKYQYNNVVPISNDIYICETSGSSWSKFTHLQSAKNRKSLNVYVNEIEFIEEILDSVYVDPLEKYLPIINARTNIVIKNDSKDTLKSLLLTGVSEGMFCSGITESYRFDNLAILPYSESTIEVLVEIKKLFRDHKRSKVCLKIVFPNKLPNDIHESVCEDYTNSTDVIDNEDFSIFPNPTNDLLNISLSNHDPITGHIEFYDQLGNSYPLIINDGQIDVSNLSPQLYFINYNNQYIGKFLKQ